MACVDDGRGPGPHPHPDHPGAGKAPVILSVGRFFAAERGHSKKQVDPSAAISIKIITEKNTRNIVKFAFDYARANGRKKVTIVHKANIMKFSDGLFLRVAQEVAAEYPDIEHDDRIIDNMCMQLMQKPELYDVLVMANLYGDIVSDLTAGMIGGLGVAPGGNIGTVASVFEPIHGSAPTHAGKNVANPTAMILSGALMLRHLGEQAAAEQVEKAVADVIAAVGQGVGPDQASVLHARSTLSRLPAPIAEAAREPHGARAVIYCLVLDKGQAVREQQLKRLQGFADPGVYTIALELMPQMDRLDAALRLPVIDIVIASLKQLSLEQYKSFRGNLLALIAMDSRVDLFEWSLHKIVLDHLDGHFLRPAPVRARIADSASLEAASAIVLSVIAHAGAEDQREVAAAFDASVRLLPFDGLALLRKDAISTADLDRAFAKLDRSTPSIKSSLMKACAASVWHDRQASALEVELLRAFASALECPVPPAVA